MLIVGTKVCKKCLEERDIVTEYYVSNLSTCKFCVKKASKEREEKIKSTPEGLEKERERHRDKYHRLCYKDVHKPTSEKKKEIIQRYKNKYPEKYKAKNSSQDLKKIDKNNELHHWSYNEEDWKDCFEMSVADHNTLHRFLIYDQETFYYKDLEGNLLDTKEKHKEYIEKQGIKIIK